MKMKLHTPSSGDLHYNLKNMITEETIKEVTDKIIQECQPEKVILFGSYAWGKPNENSDIDLFIVKETENTRETGRKISRLIFPRLFPLDIIVYTPHQIEKRKNLGDLFIKDILENGKILYVK